MKGKIYNFNCMNIEKMIIIAIEKFALLCLLHVFGQHSALKQNCLQVWAKFEWLWLIAKQNRQKNQQNIT